MSLQINVCNNLDGVLYMKHLFKVVKSTNLFNMLVIELTTPLPNIAVIDYLIKIDHYNLIDAREVYLYICSRIYRWDVIEFWEKYILTYKKYLTNMEMFKRIIPKLPIELCVVVHKYMRTMDDYKKQLNIINT